MLLLSRTRGNLTHAVCTQLTGSLRVARVVKSVCHKHSIRTR